MQPLFSNIPETTLHELFVSQAHKTPAKIALVDKEVSLTYQELDQLTDRLANYLSRYIQENDTIGIFMEKCHDYIVASLAVLKAGGTYLHLELAYPDSFLGQIFIDAETKLVITKQKFADKLNSQEVAKLYIDADDWHTADDTIEGTGVRRQGAETSNPKTIAMVGYSSGTTGKPKGVAVSHRAFIYAYFKFWEEVWHIQEKGRFAYTTFMAWDAFSPLIMGQTGYIVPDETSFDPQQLMEFIAEYQINHTFLTPSLLSCIVQTVDKETIEQKLQSLKIVWLGGEVTTQKLVNEILGVMPHLYLINNYGPAECFVITQGQLRANDSATPTICSVGKVLAGMAVMILDENMQPVQPGEAGELYATGPCLADGYLNKPELTAQKFIPLNDKLFYKTGDLARFLADGRLIILGRIDGTIKIRSYNVNLLAIEETLKQHAHIADCVVIAHGDEGEDKYLIAYLIPTDTAEWQIDPHTLHCPEISEYLEDFLPFYMIPRVYIKLDSLPLHPTSQKLDKASLPLPSYQEDGLDEGSHLSDIPLTQQEQTVIGLLKELLPQNNIKKSDDFFKLGLHSLLAAQLATRINRSLGIDLSVATIYEYCTVHDLVTHLNNGYGHHLEISWQKDAILEEKIVSSGQSTVFSPTSQAVLLTGATGFVGLFLLAQLLRVSPTLKVYCLVRSANRLASIIEKLKFYQLWEETFNERIITVVGDLGKSSFGWSQQTFEQYAEQVDAVFHAGAWVNMVYPYHKLKATNVDGTREIIRFAACKINKPLHYISTLGIFPAGHVSTYREDDQIDGLIDDLVIGYSQSKWVAEKLVWQAIERGIPAQIYRLGNIGPDSDTCLSNEKDSVMMFLDTCKMLKVAPQRDDWRFEYTPINFVAKAVVQTALSQNWVSEVYHISSQRLVTANNVFNEMKRKGVIDDIVPFDCWVEHLHAFATQTTEAKYDLLEQSLQVEEEFLTEQETFDTTLFVQQMKQCQLPLPVFDENYLMQSVYPKMQLPESN